MKYTSIIILLYAGFQLTNLPMFINNIDIIEKGYLEYDFIDYVDMDILTRYELASPRFTQE